MYSGRFRNNVVFFFLILFIGLRLTGLHALAHDEKDHVEDCFVCTHSILSDQLNPFTPSPGTPDFPEPVVIFSLPGHSEFVEVLLCLAPCPSTLFSRPPPLLG